MDRQSSLPASWSITESDNPTIYPVGAQVAMTPADDGLYQLGWGGYLLANLVHFGGETFHSLHGHPAFDGAQTPYQVEVRFAADAGHIHVTVRAGNSGSDPGDLSGTWGADAKN